MLQEVLTQLSIVVAIMLAVAIPIFIGFRRLRQTQVDWRRRVSEAAPVAGVILTVLLVNRTAREQAADLSWDVGWNFTGAFYDIEGDAILWFQQFASDQMNFFFSFIYIYAYVFMLIFPVIAYFTLADTRRLRELLAAYSLNYTIGPILYLLIIAYGPRNLLPGAFETVLYDFSPQYQYLTSEVNHNTNVFPSLHTSLAITIAIFAHKTRTQFRAWYPVAVFLGVSVAISTMYLGIHWAIDVVAGIGLAVVSVALAERLVGNPPLREQLSERFPAQTARIETQLERLETWLTTRIERVTHRLRSWNQ